jgi:hypothetical protein
MKKREQKGDETDCKTPVAGPKRRLSLANSALRCSHFFWFKVFLTPPFKLIIKIILTTRKECE